MLRSSWVCCDLVSKETPQGYYASLRSSGGLISSNMGGGGTMTTYEKLSLLIQFSMLIVEVIRCFYS